MPDAEPRPLSSLRAGVVGTGFVGVVHVHALRLLGVEVAGVVGSSPERAAAKGPRRLRERRGPECFSHRRARRRYNAGQPRANVSVLVCGEGVVS